MAISTQQLTRSGLLMASSAATSAPSEVPTSRHGPHPALRSAPRYPPRGLLRIISCRHVRRRHTLVIECDDHSVGNKMICLACSTAAPHRLNAGRADRGRRHEFGAEAAAIDYRRDDDGEDLFPHASVFDGNPDELVPGTKIEFKVMAGDRGWKAFAAHFIDDEPEGDLVLPPRPVLQVLEVRQSVLESTRKHGWVDM